MLQFLVQKVIVQGYGGIKYATKQHFKAEVYSTQQLVSSLEFLDTSNLGDFLTSQIPVLCFQALLLGWLCTVV